MTKLRIAILMTAWLTLSALPLCAAPTFATRSALSEGRWVKIRVDSTGVYRLPYSLLAEWGFADPSAVSVAGFGSYRCSHTFNAAAGAIPDDLPPVAVSHTADALVFYAEGPHFLSPATSDKEPEEHRNLYGRSSYYFVTDSPLLTSPAIETSTATAPNPTASCHTVRMRQRFYDFHPYGTGAYTFSPDIKANQPAVTHTWHLPAEAENVTYTYKYIGLPATTSQTLPTVEIEGASVTGKSGNGIRGTSNDKIRYVASPLQSYLLAPESESITVSVSDSDNRFDMLAVDHMTFAYTALDDASSLPAIWDFPEKAGAISLTALPAGATVWDVTEPTAPVRLAATSDGDDPSCSIVPYAGRIAIFASAASLPVPAFEGEVPNQNLHALDGIELLIVTPSVFRHEAERLASAHREMQGMTAAVVTQEEMANEFSSGALHPNGLRHMAWMLSGRGLRHLLIMGLGSSSPLAAGEDASTTLGVTFHTEYVDEDRYSSKNNCTDTYYALHADLPADRITSPLIPVAINVGRAPVATVDEASRFVDKCIAYLASPAEAGAPGEVLLFSCLGDENMHLTSMMRQGDAIRSAMPWATVHHGHQSRFANVLSTSIYVSPEMMAYLTDRMSRRPRLINYSGHASAVLIAYDLSLGVNRSISYGSKGVFYIAGCISSIFDKGNKSLGADMVTAACGPIATIGTSREVYMSNNHILNNAYVDAWIAARPGATLGDIFTTSLNSSHAFSSSSTARDQVINNYCYHFLGDPALPAYVPDDKAVITAVDGNPLATDPSDGSVDLPGARYVTLGGEIRGSDGKVDTSFDGVITLSLFAPARTKVMVSPNASDKAAGYKTLSIDDDELLQTIADVKQGRWSMRIMPPLTDSVGVNRIHLSAIADDRRSAAGGSTAFRVTDTGVYDDPEAAGEPLGISISVGSPALCEGEVTTESNPTLHIDITDSGAGLKLCRTAIGGVPAVKIDGRSLPYAINRLHAATPGVWSIDIPTGELADGAHTVTVTACDMAGRRSEAQLGFIVESAPLTAALTASAPLVREGVEFDLKLSSPSASEPQSTLLIRNSAGETVTRIEGVSFPYAWDLRAADGTPVPDGTYRASATLRAGTRYASSNEAQFTIFKKPE